MKYQRIHSIVEAVKFTPENQTQVFMFTEGQITLSEAFSYDALLFDEFTSEKVPILWDDYIIRDTENGGFFVLDGDYFERFFEVVD